MEDTVTRPPSEQYVGIRVTCRACGSSENRRLGTIGLYTFEGDDGEPWFEGPGVEPGGFNTSTVLRCRKGHNVPLRHDKLVPILERMKDEAGPGGRRVVTEAL
ncbi:hypothetical protein [Nocardioides pinisoli]|uniref:Uncharacterized protein n=1 Tax=Nocardioides pinisoli TaxID=2950279 RepID=A0ABT1KYB8_9ACTN|nr:hypothetical protein [Nocardioides pinisoli]MCP3422737.1 hypothetical protein [Nocardioides pinisoli]